MTPKQLALIITIALIALLAAIVHGELICPVDPYDIPYDNSLFLRPDLPGYLGDEVPFTATERARAIIVP